MSSGTAAPTFHPRRPRLGFGSSGTMEVRIAVDELGGDMRTQPEVPYVGPLLAWPGAEISSKRCARSNRLSHALDVAQRGCLFVEERYL